MSTSAEQRAALLKELARDFNRTRTSFGSSQRTHSRENTISTDFDPKRDGCLESTDLNIYITTPQKQVNTVQELPELRASAQKYNPLAPRQPRSEQDYAINTSALGRAFPDFSQAGPAASDNGSHSIETGRAHSRASNGTIGKLGRSGTRSQNSAMGAAHDNIKPTPPPINNNNESPITKPHPINNPRVRKSLNPARQETSQINQPQNGIKAIPPQMAKARDSGSGSSRQTSYMARAIRGARIASDKAGSVISEERPPSVDLTARSSRFGGPNNRRSQTGETLPSRFVSKQDFVQTLPSSSHTHMEVQNTQETVTPVYGTQQSFAVPNMPNLNELVSGVYENGEPVFSRDSTARAPRGSGRQQRQSSRSDLAHVDDIAVDDEEQDIYVALKLAQDKVADLERERAETEVFIQEIEHKNQVLESEKGHRRMQRSDSAIGLTDGASDGGDEMGGGHRKLLIEKNRLESSVRALQKQLTSTDRQAAVSEIALRNVTNERDSAVSQLGVAFFTIEQLKADNANLSSENEALRTELAVAQGAQNKHVRHTIAKSDQHPTRHEQKPEVVVSVDPPPCKADMSKVRREQTTDEPQRSSFEQFKEKLALRQAEREAREASAAQAGAKSPGRDETSENRVAEDEPHPTELFPRKRQVKPTTQYQPTEGEIEHDQHDLTFVSFVESDDLVNLRESLEHERVRDRPKIAAEHQIPKSQQQNEQSQTAETRLVSSDTNLRTEPSSKESHRKVTDPMDLTGRSWVTADDTQHRKKLINEHNRSRSETSGLDKIEQRRQRPSDNLTSAFILPDITIRHPSSGPIRQVSAGAETVLDDIKYHNGQNCTVCHQLIQRDEDHNHGETKRTIKVPKPIPVSQRMPEPDVYNEEPTLRPSQPPTQALATVIKCLEDELRHLKIKLSQYQDLYNSHDAALSKRQRKDCGRKIEGLLKDVDVKADQIYALYDALEGQKQDDHEMTEQEVEVTLQSIGIDPAEMSIHEEEANLEVPRSKSRRPWDLDSNDEEELPWEGIESTGTGRFANGMQGQPRSLSV